MKNPSRLRKLAEATAATLFVLGAWAAIILLPAIFASLILFVLIGVPGILLGYKLKTIRRDLSVGLGVTAWGYAFATVGFYGTFNFALLFDSLKTVVPIAVLGTLALARLGQEKLRRPEWLYSPDPAIVTAFKKLVPFTLLIVTPFIVAGLHDYNMRGDTSPPRVIELKVVEKWIEYRGDESTEHYILKGETLDRKWWFSFDVSESFYNIHDIGSTCWIKVRTGALGYQWSEGYE